MNLQSDEPHDPIAGQSAVRFSLRSLFVLSAIAAAIVGGATLLVPATGLRGPDRRTICLSNLKMIGYALCDYESKNGHFPLVYTIDSDGKPLCSWRTLLLPQLEESAIYSRYHLNEPWNSQNNNQLSSVSSSIFNCPSDDTVTNKTNYVAVIGPGTAWNPDHGLKLSEIKDDPADTILLVELKGSGINWAEPRDLDLNNLPPGMTPQNLLESLSKHPGVFNALFADGHVETIPSSIPWEQFMAMLTIAGGEKVDRDSWFH